MSFTLSSTTQQESVAYNTSPLPSHLTSSEFKRQTKTRVPLSNKMWKRPNTEKRQKWELTDGPTEWPIEPLPPLNTMWKLSYTEWLIEWPIKWLIDWLLTNRVTHRAHATQLLGKCYLYKRVSRVLVLKSAKVLGCKWVENCAIQWSGCNAVHKGEKKLHYKKN